MARCRFGNSAAFKWKCAALAAPAPRQFVIGTGFFEDMDFSMHKPRASKRATKSAGGLPKNLYADPALFGRLALPFFWSIGLSSPGTRRPFPSPGYDPGYRAISIAIAACGMTTIYCLLI